jgi:hypothetical protein
MFPQMLHICSLGACRSEGDTIIECLSSRSKKGEEREWVSKGVKKQKYVAGPTITPRNRQKPTVARRTAIKLNDDKSQK